MTCFMMCSTIAAVGWPHARQPHDSVSPNAPVAATTLLLAVGAAVIGGTSLFGGKGAITDAVIGGLVDRGDRQRHGAA